MQQLVRLIKIQDIKLDKVIGWEEDTNAGK